MNTSPNHEIWDDDHNKQRRTGFREHWLLSLDSKPLHKAVASCFEKPGAPLGSDIIDRVETGLDSVRIIFKSGYSFRPYKHNSSTYLRLIQTLPQDHGFDVAYDVRQGQDCLYSRLTATITWKPISP